MGQGLEIELLQLDGGIAHDAGEGRIDLDESPVQRDDGNPVAGHIEGGPVHGIVAIGPLHEFSGLVARRHLPSSPALRFLRFPKF